jgi:hypothetical protein
MATTAVDDSSGINSHVEAEIAAIGLQIDELRTMISEFLAQAQTDELHIDMEQLVREFRSRYTALKHIVATDITRVNSNSINAPAKAKVDELRVIIIDFLKRVFPISDTKLAAARELIPELQDRFNKLNQRYPFASKKPGEICIQGSLGPRIEIDLTYPHIDLLRYTLGMGLEPSARLGREDKKTLNDEWMEQVGRALHSLKRRLLCPNCGHVHHSPIATGMKQRLSNEMYGFDSEDVTLDEMNDWKDRMLEIEEVYIIETGVQDSRYL